MAEIKCPCGLRNDMEEEDCKKTNCNACCPLTKPQTNEDKTKYEERKTGHWIPHNKGKDSWCECSECHTVGSPQWKSCPVCDTKMVPSDESH